jgi:hypothetical protein
MQTNALFTCSMAATILIVSASAGWAQHRYSQAVQNACASDYKQHCAEYGIETDALRVCMKRAGPQLTKGCIDSLVAAGEITRQQAEGRKPRK